MHFILQMHTVLKQIISYKLIETVITNCRDSSQESTCSVQQHTS